jgi:hypothetical protein
MTRKRRAFVAPLFSSNSDCRQIHLLIFGGRPELYWVLVCLAPLKREASTALCSLVSDESRSRLSTSRGHNFSMASGSKFAARIRRSGTAQIMRTEPLHKAPDFRATAKMPPPERRGFSTNAFVFALSNRPQACDCIGKCRRILKQSQTERSSRSAGRDNVPIAAQQSVFLKHMYTCQALAP